MYARELIRELQNGSEDSEVFLKDADGLVYGIVGVTVGRVSGSRVLVLQSDNSHIVGEIEKWCERNAIPGWLRT